MHTSITMLIRNIEKIKNLESICNNLKSENEEFKLEVNQLILNHNENSELLISKEQKILDLKSEIQNLNE